MGELWLCSQSGPSGLVTPYMHSDESGQLDGAAGLEIGAGELH